MKTETYIIYMLGVADRHAKIRGTEVRVSNNGDLLIYNNNDMIAAYASGVWKSFAIYE